MSWIYDFGAKGIEAAFTAGWSIGEVLYALRSPDEILRDPWRSAVLADVERHGLYREYPSETRELTVRKRGWIATRNPYTYIGDHPPDKIVAQLRRPREPRRDHLVVMCHCYGLPLPPLMERIFSLHALDGFDVVYNIMNKHYWGSFGAWPGFGLATARLSQMIEVIRSAIVGLRTLIKSLRHTFGYKTVSLIGYSIGGQLALHTANAYPLDRLIAYCPVTHLHQTFTELGLMGAMKPSVERALNIVRANFNPDDLHVLNPLNETCTLKLPPEHVAVVVQRNDVMVPPHHVEPIRLRYPEVDWHEFGGTHTFPDDIKGLAAVVHGKLRGVG